MISIEIRKIIVADREDGMTVNAISQSLRVSESAIYRLFQKKRKTGRIDGNYHGRQSNINSEQLSAMKSLIEGNPDITLTEIKDALNLPIQKSGISHILRNKLEF